MCSQEAGRMPGHTLGFSPPQHLVQACHTPSHRALPCIQCTWSFQSPYGIRISDPGVLAVTARSWSKNRPLTSSLRPLCGAYTDRKVTTRWPTIGFTKMILSETLCTSKPLSILPSQTLLHQQCLCRFRTSRACTWCLCPWLCGNCHLGIWSPEYSRHPFPCGKCFQYLANSSSRSLHTGCFHPEFPRVLAWFSTMAWSCLPPLTGGQAADVTNRTLMSVGTA